MSRLEADVRRLLDIEEIKALKYRYCRHNDGGWPDQPTSHQGPSADLFIENGVWDGRPVLPLAEGREEIRRLFDRFSSLFVMAYHTVTNPIIEIDGDDAWAHWHIISASEVTSGRASLSISSYDDEYVRTDAGWRFKRIRLVTGRSTKLPEGWRGPRS
ncbi:MAG TPA: nuclear transport factor 2 family protein [Novosphingobium sp.]|nr:nuclear transport factor 2 family protein [Novosphingobium sp.]